MAEFGVRQRCHRAWRSAGGRNPPDASAERGREKNRVVGLPSRLRSPIHKRDYVGDRQWRAAAAEHLFQSSSGGEPEPLAVRRKERVACAFGARDRDAVELIVFWKAILVW